MLTSIQLCDLKLLLAQLQRPSSDYYYSSHTSLSHSSLISATQIDSTTHGAAQRHLEMKLNLNSNLLEKEKAILQKSIKLKCLKNYFSNQLLNHLFSLLVFLLLHCAVLQYSAR